MPSPSPPPETFVVPSSSPSTEGGSFTRIVLNESGLLNPVTSSGVCPSSEAAGVVIDGVAYTAGPSTVELFVCSSINADYDLIDFRLENFPEGLWFEILFKSGSIDLVIKSLADYKEYWNRVKNTFDPQEYAGESGNSCTDYGFCPHRRMIFSIVHRVLFCCLCRIFQHGALSQLFVGRGPHMGTIPQESEPLQFL